MSVLRTPKVEAVNPIIGRLVQARIEAGLSQDKLAKRLAVRQVTISRWENGQAAVSLANVIRWAADLGLALTITTMPVPDGLSYELLSGGLA